VNVAAPLLELSALIVTLCAVAKFDGVNVSEPPAVTDRPVLPEVRATDTVTFEDGAEDSDTPTVPVPPWVMVCEVGVTIRLGVPVVEDGTSVAVTTAEVYPPPAAVKVVVPVPATAPA
jgi:hypothetical protein